MLDKLVLDKANGKQEAVYKQIAAFLSAEIREGRVGAGERLPAVGRMVRAWEVDFRTVYRALDELVEKRLIELSDRRGVGPLVCECKAQAAGQKVSYVRLRPVPGYHLDACAGVGRGCAEAGIEFQILDFSETPPALKGYLKQLPANHVLVLAPPPQPVLLQALEEAVGEGSTIIFVDECVPGVEISSVSHDHLGAAFRLTNWLVEKTGARAWFFNCERHRSAERRQDGWAMAMQMQGFHDASKYQVHVSFRNVTTAAVRFLKSLPDAPTGVLAATGSAVLPLYEAAEKVGRKIGKDLYVASFGGTRRWDDLSPRVVRLVQDWGELGGRVASLAQDLLRNPSPAPVHVVLPPVFEFPEEEEKG
jgi:DNA-binding LacI/PurR family transcriptional regulator